MTENINTTKKIDHDVVAGIKDKMIRCKIIPNKSSIKCFFYKHNNGHFLSYVKFDIQNIDITMTNPFDQKVDSKIKQIKLALSYNNNFFICYLLGSTPICKINEYSANDLKDISCSFNDCSYNEKYKVLYFNETNDFLFVARNPLETTIISIFDNSVKSCKMEFLGSQEKEYAIIYVNSYKAINYSSFSNNFECHKISIKEEETTLTSQTSILVKSIKIFNKINTSLAFGTTTNNILDKISDFIFVNNNTYFLNPNYISYYNIIPKTNEAIISNSTYIKEITTKTKEEIFNNIKNVLTDKQVGVNYEIKGEDFTIIIKPTNSTPLPNTTHVDFNDCEKIIRKEYNISNSSIITFLQIEIENNNKNSLYNVKRYFMNKSIPKIFFNL